jgi:hypothetical protein
MAAPPVGHLPARHPPLHHRLTAPGMPAAATDLETGVHHWTRMVKLALGLHTPDLLVGPDCPRGR